MASEGSRKAAIPTKEEFDVIQNRIALALAQREALVKSWTAKSSRAGEPEKTDAELEEEDAILFRPEPPYLGVGAPIPSHFLVSDAERNNKSLRAKFFPKGGLKGSKTRDAEEKAVSAKRGLNAESSDEEEGRSSLGKAKKQKRATSSTAAIEVKQEIKDEVKLKDKDEAKPTDQSRETDSNNSGSSDNQTEVRPVPKEKIETSPARSVKETRREKLREIGRNWEKREGDSRRPRRFGRKRS